jgi:hypothetical protein
MENCARPANRVSDEQRARGSSCAFHVRAMSYLTGPLTRGQIKTLM